MITLTQQQPLPEARYEVVVHDEGEESRHVVDVPAAYLTALGVEASDAAVEDLLRRSFAFLLERESSKSILKKFTLSDIERYFPEYRRARES